MLKNTVFNILQEAVCIVFRKLLNCPGNSEQAGVP